jgi:hypothetical protein
MEFSNHCELCDHRQSDLKTGITCGLTERKPFFNKTCNSISLTKKFEDKLILVNFEYQNVLRMRYWTYVYLAVFIVMAALTILLGYFTGHYIFGNGAISVGPLFIMGLGVGLFGMGIGTYNKYQRDFKRANLAKGRLDKILNLYRIPYDISLEFKQKFHGKQEVVVNLNLQGNRSNQTLLMNV